MGWANWKPPCLRGAAFFITKEKKKMNIEKETPSVIKRKSKETLISELESKFSIQADAEMDKDVLIELYTNAQDAYFESEYSDASDEANEKVGNKVADDANSSGGAGKEEVPHANGSLAKDREKVTFIVASEKDGNPYCDYNVNGVNGRIKRGKEVTLPRFIYENLKGLNEGFYEADEDGNDVLKEQPRFNVSLV